MAIQRGIALSACSETTAGLTLGQGFQPGAQQQQQRACARTCTAGEERRLGPSAWVCTMGSMAGPGPSSNAPMGCEMPHASRPDIDEQWRWRWRFASHHASVGGRVGWPDASMVGRRGQYVFARSVSGGGLASS